MKVCVPPRITVHITLAPETLRMLDKLVQDDSAPGCMSARGRVIDFLVRQASEPVMDTRVSMDLCEKR